MTDPFLITGPALISFSGGRTSAYLLWHILQAHGGKLPDDAVVAFFNTGKEAERTLRFVHECDVRWRAGVRMLEYSIESPGFTEVDFNALARRGEPFEALISKKGYVPNRGAGYCSIELKARVGRDFCRTLGWRRWNSVVGLRADEMDRVMSARLRSASKKDPWHNVMPLASAGITRRDVLAFWLGATRQMGHDLPQGFDLGLWDYEGNCDLCWKKSRTKRARIIRDNPPSAAWWAEQERRTGSTFAEAEPVAALVRHVASSPALPLDFDQDHDAECGLWCPGEAA